MVGRRRQDSNVRLLAAVLAGAVGILVAVPAALAQSPADQYIPSPKPADTGGNDRDPGAEQSDVASSNSRGSPTAFGPSSEPPSGPRGGQGAGSGGNNAAATTGREDEPADGGGTDGRGGTDYPLTPFTTAVLGLLALGLLARLALAVRGRLRGA